MNPIVDDVFCIHSIVAYTYNQRGERSKNGSRFRQVTPLILKNTGIGLSKFQCSIKFKEFLCDIAHIRFFKTTSSKLIATVALHHSSNLKNNYSTIILVFYSFFSWLFSPLISRANLYFVFLCNSHTNSFSLCSLPLSPNQVKGIEPSLQHLAIHLHCHNVITLCIVGKKC